MTRANQGGTIVSLDCNIEAKKGCERPRSSFSFLSSSSMLDADTFRMRRMREFIFSVHILRWQAKETSLVVVYRIPYPVFGYLAFGYLAFGTEIPTTKTIQTRAHRADPWRWATGGYFSRQHQILPRKHRILLQVVLLNFRNQHARAVVSLKHRNTSWIAVQRTAACMRTHSKSWTGL